MELRWKYAGSGSYRASLRNTGAELAGVQGRFVLCLVQRRAADWPSRFAEVHARERGGN